MGGGGEEEEESGLDRGFSYFFIFSQAVRFYWLLEIERMKKAVGVAPGLLLIE